MGIFAGMILFTILFSFVLLIVDYDYYANNTAEKMGGYVCMIKNVSLCPKAFFDAIHHILGLILVRG